MLTCWRNASTSWDAEMETAAFGQELNPFTFGIAKADMLIRGGNPDNMKFGDTLNNDQFEGYTFDFIISNPTSEFYTRSAKLPAISDKTYRTEKRCRLDIKKSEILRGFNC